MAVENFTTYTEVDEDSDITVTATSISADTIRRDATSYVKFVYPTDTFGNFVHKFDFNFSAASADTALCQVWMLSNSSNTLQEAVTNNDGIGAFVYRNTSGSYRFYLQEYVTDVQDFTDWGSPPGARYVTIQRNGAVLTAMIFTDGARTVLEDVVQITCPTTAYAWVFGLSSRDAAPTDTPTVTVSVSNLDLQFAGAGTSVSASFGDGIKARSSVIAPPKQQARKPYLSLKQSMREFFSEHVRFIKNQNRKESAFEKPYNDFDYNAMHLDIPVPDWPSWKPWTWTPGDWTPSGPPGGGGVPTKNCPGCALYADAPVGFDCSNPVEVHSGIYCTDTPGAPTEGITTTETQVFNSAGQINPQLKNLAGQDAIVDAKASGVVAGDTTLEIYAQAGQIVNITVGAWAFIGPSAAVYVEPLIQNHRICGKMTDGAGSICYACVDVLCVCDCTSVETFRIDSATTDDTITPGSVATIVVLGGCPPFTWGVAGNGYVLSKLSTTDRTNYVISAAGACGAGAGNYAAFVTVTITDDCGTVLTKNIRSTGGSWTTVGAHSEGSCLAGGAGGCTATYNGATFIRDDNLKRWTNTCSSPAGCGSPYSSQTFPAVGGCPGDTEQYTESGCGSDCWYTQTYEYWTCGAC
jgi:hypothetical protein